MLCSRLSWSVVVGLGDKNLLLLGQMKTHRLTTSIATLALLVLLPILLAAGWQQAPQDTVPNDGRDFIYGRVTTTDGEVYEGRLRWGGSQEAFWDDQFNGVKNENIWAVHVSPERLKDHRPVVIFGFHIATRERSRELNRPFMARFGDLARIDTERRTFRVTLKSGTVHELDRFASDDLADGVRVWDASRGVVDVGEWDIRSIQFLPTPKLDNPPDRLHGTVYTETGSFRGFIQWNRQGGVVTDELNGQTPDGSRALPFHSIQSIVRNSEGGSLVTLRDSREFRLSGTPEVGDGNRGAYVNDPRYGRVLVSWESFLRADFDAGGVGPAFEEVPAGVPLTGSVTTCGGRKLTGRLVYDLDESETTETLDAPWAGVNYSIPFSLIASVNPSACGASDAVTSGLRLHDGTALTLENEGDLAGYHAGVLVFGDGDGAPEYLRWDEIKQVDLDRASVASL